MEGFKNVLASKTIWGTMITAAFVLFDTFGVNVGIDQTEALELVTKAGELLGLVIAAYGRITATKQIGSPA